MYAPVRPVMKSWRLTISFILQSSLEDENEENNVTLDMYKMLKQDLHNRELYVHRKKIQKVLRLLLLVFFLLVVMGLLIFTAVQLGHIKILV